MKYIAVVVLFAIVGLAYCRPDDGQYTTKYDNVDIDQILKSDRLINSYFKCLMTGDGCTPDGAELKKILPDAIETGCSKCSRKHKDGSKKIINHIIINKPD
ncbi:A10/OS-D family protein, partial [Klebsiella pneumoniae]|uniref:A10/OS-D family protein n=1 Tax=Klebsiella pneumoniae TaxID=573 RepID=UPI003A80BE85